MQKERQGLLDVECEYHSTLLRFLKNFSSSCYNLQYLLANQSADFQLLEYLSVPLDIFLKNGIIIIEVKWNEIFGLPEFLTSTSLLYLDARTGCAVWAVWMYCLALSTYSCCSRLWESNAATSMTFLLRCKKKIIVI